MDTESLPSSLLWSSHWSLACLCHPSVSLRRRAKTSSHLTQSLPIPAPLSLSRRRGRASLLLERKTDYSVLSAPLILPLPRNDTLLQEIPKKSPLFLLTFANVSLFSFITPPCSPSAHLLLNIFLLLFFISVLPEQNSPPHPPSYVQTGEAVVEIGAKAVPNSALLL